MLWILAIVIVIICIFLWMVVRSASNSIDEETQRLLDEEQTRAVDEYLKNAEKNAKWKS